MHRGGTWANFSDNCVKSLHIMSHLRWKGHPLSALASVGDPYTIWRIVTSVIVADRNESTAGFGCDLHQR